METNQNDLIFNHINLVTAVALTKGKKYNFDHDQLDDLVGTALYALVYSVKRYQKRENAVFRTFLYKVLEGFMKTEIKKILYGTRNYDENNKPFFISIHDREIKNSKLPQEYTFEEHHKFDELKVFPNYNDHIDIYDLIHCPSLKIKEQEVLECFLEDDVTFADIARQMNLSRERVRQIYNSAIRKLKRKQEPNFISKR